MAAVGLAQHRVNAREADDAPATLLLDHLPSRLLRAQEHTFQVRAEDEIPIRFRHIHDLREADDTSVVDQDIQSAQELDGWAKAAFTCSA